MNREVGGELKATLFQTNPARAAIPRVSNFFNTREREKV